MDRARLWMYILVLVVASPLPGLSCGADGEIVRDIPGDVDEAIARTDLADKPAQAEALLATDRPWRAAQLMRSYLSEIDDAPDDHRLLAARAEAGWGGWHEVVALLEDVPALDTYRHGIGLYLLARGHDATGDAAGAAEAYRDFLALSAPAGELETERAAARLLLGLALTRLGERTEARRELDLSAEHAGAASVWLALLEADALAHTGDRAGVDRLVAGHDSGLFGLRAWRARIAAARAAGDLPAARDIATRARGWAGTATTRAEFLVEAGRIAIEMGDVPAGRAALRGAIAQGAAGPYAREAAALLQEGQMAAADYLAVARVYRAQGLHQESLEGYRRWLESGQGPAGEQANVRMEYANALFYAERFDEVEAALQPIRAQPSARMLVARSEAHLSNFDRATEIYLAVARDQAGSGTGRLALLLAAGTRHDEGDFDRAREIYRRLINQYAGSSEMGLAMMRLAGIHFMEEDYVEAARVWDEYRARYPRGQLTQQATYWAARAHAERGDNAAAASLLRRVRQQARDSYYALMASERLGEPFWPLPLAASPPDDPAAAQRVADWMQGIDLLREAGFPEDASAEADRVVSRAGSDRMTLYALAEALIERGYSQRAIRIGQQLQRSERQNRRLLRILYPFPYRTLITEEARDRGLDPFISAALIRQESLFEARITSPAGARGLMQIMPATGRRLAEAAGVDPWDAELLYHPEINVHLGTRYVAQHSENYDGALPPIFSAYNAGAHRVEWWSSYPEYGHDELFTERIPFRETRDYVKILTTNHAIYRGLYGGED